MFLFVQKKLFFCKIFLALFLLVWIALWQVRRCSYSVVKFLLFQKFCCFSPIYSIYIYFFFAKKKTEGQICFSLFAALLTCRIAELMLSARYRVVEFISRIVLGKFLCIRRR